MDFFYPFWFMPLALIAAAWVVYWKYRALWKAAHLGDKKWFIALLIINTLGILEILYIYTFSKNKHFICTGGCKGVSDKPGVCQAENCPKHRHPLEPCDCKDGKHYG